MTISSAFWIQYTNVTDGQKDRHRVTAKTALIRIAPRGKKQTKQAKVKGQRKLNRHIIWERC